ncbi:MAG TPA: MaoC/PaaZ C-terminal domain-containing protein [Rubrobacteraceae bacterium]|nr:MaoC/PaaZ C-terminal domain-containing protein [Rubrobacteraceae bacterium]
MSQETSNRPAWKVGDELKVQTLPPITRLQLIKYAGASGDFNPIHTIDAAAEEAGLPGIIAHGMLTLATMGLLFSPYLENGYVKELKARFSGMVFLGDKLSIGGRVLDAVDYAEGSLYTFEVSARRGDDVVASGTVGFVVFGG